MVIHSGRSFALIAAAAGVSAFVCLSAATLLTMATSPRAIAADAPERVFTLSITAGVVPVSERTIRVQKGEMVRWRVSSDAPGDLHLHAYRVDAAVLPGKPAEVAFKAFATGRFRVEWHPAAGKATGGGGHHAAPLATFEVRPR